MKVLNIHERVIDAGIDSVLSLFATLSSDQDQLWPRDKWPKMRLNNGLMVGSTGGHGPISYDVIEYDASKGIAFQFSRPQHFIGIHRFDIDAVDSKRTRLKHTIDMDTKGLGTVQWLVAIRWLHDALIEDAFDGVETRLTNAQPKTRWNWWVRFWRSILK